jgi:transcriptional regulator with PAS, ATPase and Fis domain
MVSAGKFRSDLYYRLNVMMISIAPLRERGDDILLLAKHFMQLTEKRYGLTKHTLSQTAIEALQHYSWPGNVRELRHQISRAVLLASQTQISATDLMLVSRQPIQQTEADSGQLTLEASEKKLLLNALEVSRNNVSEAARMLNVSRMTMRYRMDKHHISR